MPSDNSQRRIDEVLGFAGLDPRTDASLLVREVLESINTLPAPQTDREFARLLQQISDRSLTVR